MPAAATATATADAMHELCRCSDHLMHQVKRGRRSRLHPISSQKQISSEQQRQGKQTQSDTSQKDNLKQYPRSSILSWCSFSFSFLIGLRRILMVIWNCSKGGEHVRCAGVGGKEGKSWVWVWNLTVIQPEVLDRIRPGERGWVVSGRQTRECSRQV